MTCNKLIGRTSAVREVGRSVFQNHLVRFVRVLTQDNAPVEIMVDMWKVEGHKFTDIESARHFAKTYVEKFL